MWVDEFDQLYQRMATKTHDVAEDEDQMIELEEVDDNLRSEPVPSTSAEQPPWTSGEPIPSTSSASDSSQLVHKETQVKDANECDIELTFPPSFFMSAYGYWRWPKFRMLHFVEPIQEEDEDEIEGDEKRVKPALPKPANRWISYHSLIRERNYLNFQIDNIRKVMACWQTAVKRWLELIEDATFPQPEYLTEYLEGTNTLHELQRKEMAFLEKHERVTKLVNLRRNVKEETPKEKEEITILMVHLPENQYTNIQVQKGLTLRKAVFKAMQHRHLEIDECAAYIKQRITSSFISWDTDISTLQCKEVFVETLEAITVPVFFIHNFERVTFLKITYCCACAKSVLQGYHCNLCDRKYHLRCVAFAPILCEHIKRRRAYYERLLSNNMTTGIMQVRARPPPTPSSMAKKRQENQENQESSTSLPNVAISQNAEGSKTKDGISKTRAEVSTTRDGVSKTRDDVSKTKGAIPKTKDTVSKTKAGVSKTKGEVSKTKGEVSKTKDGASKTKDGASKTKDGASETKDGTSKTKFGVFKTKHGFFKTKYRLFKKKDSTVEEEEATGKKKRGKKKNKKSTKEDDSHTSTIERAKSEDSIFSNQDSANDFKIGAKEVTYDDDDKIGQGTYGSVYKGEYYGPVAIKKLNISTPTAEQIRSFKNEVNILRKIRHKHVLLFMGCICSPYLAIVTQWCEGQSLHHRLHVSEDPLELITLVIILKQSSEGMEYVHSKNIHHRDLKSYNIFFHNGLHVKIGDFGLAVMRNQNSNKEKDKENEEKEKDEEIEEGVFELKFDGEDEQQKAEREKAEREKAEREAKARKEQENKFAGSIPWMAPEVLRMKEEYPYSFQSDVYSFGIVMYELFAREIPYGLGADPLFILYNVGRGSLRPDSTKMRSDMPKKLKVLYEQCIAFERENRPLFPYILKQVYAVFRETPKIRRTTSLPLDPSELADTYIERDEDVQDFLTSDDDYEAIFGSNTGIYAGPSVDVPEDVFANF